jgi:cytochrome c oxidase subunit II
MKPRFGLFPEQASTVASHVDWVTLVLLALCGLILIIVFGLIFLFGILYRQGSPNSREITLKNPSLLEWGWTIATFFVFLIIFVWAAHLYFRMHTAPPNSNEIAVIGKQWMWKFQHLNGKREINELHIPVNQPMLLTMTSQDVIHSFFVPEFRVKQDVLPGRYSKVWFQATKIGEYHLFCTQYCGTLHSGMTGKIIVMSQDDYQRWLQSGISDHLTGIQLNPSLSMASKGRKLFTRLGCISCHGNQPGVLAPSLHGIFGKNEQLSDGTSIFVDENYLRESILNPNAKIVKGYQAIMPTFMGLINEEDLLNLIAYIKALSGTPATETPEGPPQKPVFFPSTLSKEPDHDSNKKLPER